jgi:hypothetical protein
LPRKNEENPTGADSASLDRIWSEITERLPQLNLVIFPSIPLMSDSGVLAFWPDADWNRFLDVAVGSGARIIYAECSTFDESDYLGLLGDEEDGANTSQSQAARTELRSRIGSTIRLRLAFSVDGVLHEWEEEASWWFQEASSPEESETDHYESRYSASEKLLAEFQKRSESEGWVQNLAEDRRCREPARGRERRILIREFLVDHGFDGEPTDEVQVMALRRLEYDLMRAVDERLKTVVQPRLEAEAIEKLGQFYEELSQTNPAWSSSTVKMRETLARRFLRERYGMSMTLVVDMLARYKPSPASSDSS